MSILYAISIVYIAGEYDGPGFCTPIGIAPSTATFARVLHPKVPVAIAKHIRRK